MIVGALEAMAVPVGQLRMLEGNPRRGNVEAVARSLERFGQLKPVVATPDGTVVAGNHTLAAAISLGWSHIAVNYADLDEPTAKAYALADNRTAELGTYDEVDLAAMLAGVRDVDAALFADTGWTDADLALLLAKTAMRPPVAEPDTMPGVAPARTSPGDRWFLGPHRLVCGDATEPADLEALMGSERADLVWTDPPYGVEIVGGNHALTPTERLSAGGKTISNDERNPAELERFLHEAFGLAVTVCKPGAAWFVTAPAGPPFRSFMVVLDDLGIWRQTLIWLKDSLVMGRTDYHYRHEELLYGWVPGGPHRPPPDRTYDSVWEVPRPKRSEDHPTMKPVQLIAQALDNHTDAGGIVLDPFAGSGSTLVAAEITGRVARCVELDPTYCDVICARYQTITGSYPVAASGEACDFLEADD